MADVVFSIEVDTDRPLSEMAEVLVLMTRLVEQEDGVKVTSTEVYDDTEDDFGGEVDELAPSGGWLWGRR